MTHLLAFLLWLVLGNLPATRDRDDQAPAVASRPEWGGQLEQARASLVDMPEAEWRRMWQVAQVLASSALVPKVLAGNPQGVMAVGLHCRALQIPFTAMSAKQHFHVWDDNRGVVIQPSAQLMLGLLHRAGHEAWWGPCDETSATLHVIRAGTTRQQDFTYTVAMAAKAGLTSKDNWKNHPGLMCRAGACRMAGRYAAPEALLGLDMFDHVEAVSSAPAGPSYQWEVSEPEAMGDRPELSPAEFDRPVARLHRQIQALPTWARNELAGEWKARKLPAVQHPDFVARLAEAEDLVDEITARAFALPLEAEGVRETDNGDGGREPSGNGTDDTPPVSTNGPARPLAQQIAMQAKAAGVDHHHVMAALGIGKASAKDLTAPEGRTVLECIAAIAEGRVHLVQTDEGGWDLDMPEPEQQTFAPDDPSRPFD